MTGEGREGGVCDTATSCRYNEDLELEDAVHTAILTLKVRPSLPLPSLPLPFSLFSILFFSSLPFPLTLTVSEHHVF